MAAGLNVAVIAPHPDDEAIGCGGAICLHVARGDRVVAIFLTSGELGLKHLRPEDAWKIREKEARHAAKILGIARLTFLRQPDWNLRQVIKKTSKKLVPVLKEIKPKLVYLPHAKEWHPDHQAAWPIVRGALVNGGFPWPELRGYEVWTPLAKYDEVEDISSVMSRKLRAIRAHRSQLGELDYAHAVRGLNQYRGVIAGRCAFAEVFQAIKS